MSALQHNCEVPFPLIWMCNSQGRVLTYRLLSGFLQIEGTHHAHSQEAHGHNMALWKGQDTCYPTHDYHRRHYHHHNPNNCSCGKHGFQQFQMGQLTDSFREHFIVKLKVHKY